MSHLSERLPQIIAMGGSSLGEGSEAPLLEKYILEQTDVSQPRICFLPTASGDADSYIVKFYAGMLKLDCRPTHLKLFGRTPELRETLLSQDVIYVGGGNTRSMLGVWRAYGLPDILREAWQSGVVLCGSSAGAICWFEQSLTDAFSERLTVLDCLGFIQGSLIPHYDSEPERRPAFHMAIRNAEIVPGYALDDGVALHFIGERLRRAVSERTSARAFFVHKSDEIVIEEELNVERV
jgi:dipeptidase E